jgi:4-hydroxy-2-oxoheptanedioate aldolase
VLTTEFSARSRAGELVMGAFASIPDAATAEAFARCGFDYVCFDAEHSPLDRATIESLIRAADVTNTPAIVRVPGLDRVWISSVLDSGAAGVVVPRVDSAADAAAAAAAVRYPPRGIRGAGPIRASQYGVDREYLTRSIDDTLLAVQVETLGGLADVEAIARTEGVDIVFVGPGDLGISLRAAGRGDELDEAIVRVFAAAKAAGKTAGIFCRATSEDVAQRIAAGATWLAVGSDRGYLTQHATATLSALRREAAVASSAASV